MDEMGKDPELCKILRALQDTDKGDFVKEERSRRQAVRKSRVDEDVDMIDNIRDESGVGDCFYLIHYIIQLFGIRLLKKNVFSYN